MRRLSFLRLLKVSAVAVAAVFAFACSQSSPEPKRKSYVIAESKAYEATLYRQNCAICHGAEANGKMLDGKLVPSLRQGDIEKRTEEEIYQQIKFGKLPMPSFVGHLTEDEIQKMVRFIRRDLQGKEQ